MRSLQVLTPARECIYNCPFCISRSHFHNNIFANTYEEDREEWARNYEKVLKEHNDLFSVVITGTNEAMQDPDCVLDIINITRDVRPDVQIELQTRVYKEHPIYHLVDVAAFSISEFENVGVPSVIPGVITRYTVILTDSFNGKSLDDIISKIPEGVTQLTFKILQTSHGVDQEMDDWIAKHHLDDETRNSLKEEIKNTPTRFSIFFDETCMDAENRYMVFREDGNLYKNYDATSPVAEFTRKK